MPSSGPPPVRLDLTYTTRYSYVPPAGSGVTALRLRPRTRPGLTVESSALEARPGRISKSYVDGWGTHVDIVEHHALHASATYTLEATVATQPAERHAALAPDERALFAAHSRRTPASDIAGLGWQVNGEGRSWTAVLSTLAWVPQRFVYELGGTHAQSTVAEVVTLGAGVCQDFAHVFLALLRSWGWPARYVSGYVFNPTEGETRIEALAMHAWVEVFHDDAGWVGMDPTTGLLADERYIPVGFGRDYDDIAPIRGMITGTAQQWQDASLVIQLAQSQQQQ
jgi:transglutaminase-like putative cysteine protease